MRFCQQEEVNQEEVRRLLGHQEGLPAAEGLPGGREFHPRTPDNKRKREPNSSTPPTSCGLVKTLPTAHDPTSNLNPELSRPSVRVEVVKECKRSLSMEGSNEEAEMLREVPKPPRNLETDSTRLSTNTRLVKTYPVIPDRTRNTETNSLRQLTSIALVASFHRVSDCIERGSWDSLIKVFFLSRLYKRSSHWYCSALRL